MFSGLDEIKNVNSRISLIFIGALHPKLLNLNRMFAI